MTITLTDFTLDHVFHDSIIAYCQQNRYLRLAIYTDLSSIVNDGIEEV